MILFKKEKVKYKKQLLNAKRESFKHYLDKIVIKNSFGAIYKLAKSKTRRQIPMANILKSDGTFTNSIYDSQREILSFRFPAIATVSNRVR